MTILDKTYSGPHTRADRHRVWYRVYVPVVAGLTRVVVGQVVAIGMVQEVVHDDPHDGS